jgi:hypothetical protein
MDDAIEVFGAQSPVWTGSNRRPVLALLFPGELVGMFVIPRLFELVTRVNAVTVKTIAARRQ